MSAAQAHRRPPRGRHSIWELALHIAYWDYAVRRRLLGEPAGSFPRSPANWPLVPDRATEAAWAADRAVLAAAHRDLLAAIRGFPPARLGRHAGGRKRWTYGDLIIGIAMHDAYHAGQIQMLKRLVGVR